MYSTTGDGAPGPGSWLHARSLRPSVLIVEDDDSVREMLTCVLEADGFSVTEAESAEAGLHYLDQYDFDLVLTDYSLPRGDGAWMLREAALKGRLANTPAFIVTAHHDQPFPDDYQVIPKPLDLDGMIGIIRAAVSRTPGNRGRTLERRTRWEANDHTRKDGDGGGGQTRPVIELVLYISSESAHATTALKNVQAALSRYKGQPVNLIVHDLSKNPQPRDGDQVHFTPTLVNAGGRPRTWIIGHIDNPDVLVSLLDSLDVPPGDHER